MSLQLLDDQPSHFTLSDGKRQFQIAKKGLGSSTVQRIQRFACGGVVKRMDEGGEVTDDLVLPEAQVEPITLASAEQPPPPDYIEEAVQGPPPELSPEAAGAIEQSQVTFPSAPQAAPAAPPPAALPDPFGGRGPLRNEILNAPAVQPAPGPAMPQAPQTPPMPQLGGYRVSPMMRGVQDEVSAASIAQQNALKQQAQFQADQFAQMHQLQQQYNAESQALHQQFTQRMNVWQQRSDQLFESVRNARVDPDRYWSEKSSLAKTGSIIGILLSGIGQGLSNAARINAPNLALAALDKAVDNDIEAQKFNINKQSTLLGQHLQMGASMLQAEQLVRADLKDVFAGQMLEAAYKFGGPEAIAVADAQAAALRAQAAQARGAIAAMDVGIQERSAQIAHLGKQMQVLDVQIQAYNQAVQVENAKKLGLIEALKNGQPVSQRDLYRAMGIPDSQIVDIPGAPGQSRIAPGSKEEIKSVREMMTIITEGTAAIGELENLLDKGSSLSVTDRAEATVWVGALTGLLRLPLTGPGAMSEGERKMIEEIVANPTAIFSLTPSNRRKLATLRKVLRNKMTSTLGAYTTVPGLVPPGSELRTFTPRYANED